MNHTSMPVIRLEVDNMKHVIHAVLSESTACMDGSIRAAVDAYCTPENIDHVVHQAARRALDAVIEEEVRTFFQHTQPGRQAVREAVYRHLTDQCDSHRY